MVDYRVRRNPSFWFCDGPVFIQFLVDYVQLGLEIDDTTSRALRRVCEIILMNLEMMMSNHETEEKSAYHMM
ncbi:hypothetical protein L1987_86047 [Smallanthus sonchifolius]|uniref:Uncharacterized protein n=1 Tax=Smallanthus sonchifolius TaxID=185202 RepID=A0ACB8XYW3_9ASTR|nr:hypothetical protein L1987_86047 [Smallanthus sonchifolius]